MMRIILRRNTVAHIQGVSELGDHFPSELFEVVVSEGVKAGAHTPLIMPPNVIIRLRDNGVNA